MQRNAIGACFLSLLIADCGDDSNTAQLAACAFEESDMRERDEGGHSVLRLLQRSQIAVCYGGVVVRR